MWWSWQLWVKFNHFCVTEGKGYLKCNKIMWRRLCAAPPIVHIKVIHKLCNQIHFNYRDNKQTNTFNHRRNCFTWANNIIQFRFNIYRSVNNTHWIFDWNKSMLLFGRKCMWHKWCWQIRPISWRNSTITKLFQKNEIVSGYFG